MSSYVNVRKKQLHRRIQRLRQALEWYRCKYDEQYFFENYWHIRHPGKGCILFGLRDAQKEALNLWAEEPATVTLKSRQVGWSTLIAAWAFHKTYFWNEPRHIILLSAKQDLSQKLLGQCFYGFQRLPGWMQEMGPRRTNRSVKTLIWSNGSMIESLPSKKDPARGSSVWAVILDEWASFENPEDAWASVEPIADIGRLAASEVSDPSQVGGRVIALSTPKGAGNFFHKFWLDSRAGENGFHPIFVPWGAVPERDDAWYEEKKRTLPEWQLHQEYVSDEAMAFIKSGNTVFNLDVIARIQPQEFTRGVINSVNGFYSFKETKLGSIEMFFDVDVLGHYVIGADVAQGIEGGDYSTADVVRLAYWDYDGTYYPEEQVCCYHGHCDPDQFAHELANLGFYYNRALVGVEANSHGQSTLNELRRHIRYPRIFTRRIRRYRQERYTDEMGFWSSKLTKPAMIDDLHAALRDQELIVNSPGTKAELSNYVRVGEAMMGSPHDDRVMSLGIAHHVGLSHVGRIEKDDAIRRNGWTWNEVVKDMKDSKKMKNGRVIGR